MIYYVEDDRNIRDLVVYTLEHTGYRACGCATGEAFFEACCRDKPELVLLDVMLPGEDGFAILRRIRADEALRDVPIMMVTAKGAEYDKVLGLDSGADDYIVKPFGMMEMVSRVKALLRRAAPKPAPGVLRAGALAVDTRGYAVSVGNVPVPLTHKEFELLRMLMENRGVAFSRDHLLRTVWGYDYDGGTRTVDVHVQTLRQKLMEAGGLIETVRGVGYRFAAHAQQEARP